jgi:hypothetical protein
MDDLLERVKYKNFFKRNVIKKIDITVKHLFVLILSTEMIKHQKLKVLL